MAGSPVAPMAGSLVAPMVGRCPLRSSVWDVWDFCLPARTPGVMVSER